MIEQKHVTVNGTQYMMTSIPGTKGVRIARQLAKLLGPTVAAMQAEGEVNIVSIVTALVDSLDDSTEPLILALIQSVSKDNQAINFDTEFSANYDTLFMLLKEVVEFNFKSVFQILGSDAQ
ncbi:hypothetical protein D3C80_526920 [compost metagenome]